MIGKVRPIDDLEIGQPEKDEATGRFLPGNNGGPGRPKGARNKLGEAFLDDMLTDWQQHGPAAIVQVRTEKPDAYLKVVASILPRDLNVNLNPMQEATDDELVQRLRDLESIIRPFLGAQGSDGDRGRDGASAPH